jgi:hypothetical protein
MNGLAIDMDGSVQKTSKDFPWWRVPDALLQQLGADDATTRINNLLQWLSEEQPSLSEAFSERVLRSKAAHFFAETDVAAVPKTEWVEYLIEDLR